MGSFGVGCWNRGEMGLGYAQNKGVIWQEHDACYKAHIIVPGHRPLLGAPWAGFGPQTAIWEGLL